MRTFLVLCLKLVLAVVIGGAVVWLMRESYLTGLYVGIMSTRTEAIEHRAGYIDRDGFHWRSP